MKRGNQSKIKVFSPCQMFSLVLGKLINDLIILTVYTVFHLDHLSVCYYCMYVGDFFNRNIFFSCTLAGCPFYFPDQTGRVWEKCQDSYSILFYFIYLNNILFCSFMCKVITWERCTSVVFFSLGEGGTTSGFIFPVVLLKDWDCFGTLVSLLLSLIKTSMGFVKGQGLPTTLWGFWIVPK